MELDCGSPRRQPAVGRLLTLTLGVFLLAGMTAPAMAQTCARADFEAVVDETAVQLRQLNTRNRPAFELRLRQLREKRGWTQEQFMANAVPFVQDETIADYESRSADFLARINDQGQPEGAAPDCRLLEALRKTMGDLVATQSEKWAYMFGKIDKAIAE